MSEVRLMAINRKQSYSATKHERQNCCDAAIFGRLGLISSCGWVG